MRPDEDPGVPRRLARGEAFVYVLPRRDDTQFKIGFSRDPVERWQTLHRRFFEFFDLDRGILVATDRVSDARRIERSLLSEFSAYTSLAPLRVPASAGGSNEWFRGVLDDAVASAAVHAERSGLVVHRPASAWLRTVLIDRTDLLFAWTRRMLDLIEFERHNPAGEKSDGATRYERSLGDALDAMVALNIDFTPHVPTDVVAWQVARRAAATGDWTL
ncbi:MAG: GIY-YIG nuclease family protein [Dokdonella sp.]|uniref:GIY-YIG nuclease family protein n=1 Tax=Dokdonella sp. TaxID=2291710 RepID=UPI0032668E9A